MARIPLAILRARPDDHLHAPADRVGMTRGIRRSEEMGRGQVLHSPHREDPMHSSHSDRGGPLLCGMLLPCRNVGTWERGGHKDVQTTMAYTHVLNRGGRGVRSPMDGFQKAVSSEGGIRPTAPVGLKQEASFRDMPQLPVNTMVAGLARGGDFVLGRPGSVLSRFSPIMS
jgi:hypothetical protein